MKKKNRLIAHLSNYWIFHLLWIVFSISMVLFEFNYLTKPKANEKIDFFIGVHVKDENEFSNLLSENKPSYLKKIGHRFVNPDSVLFYQTFYTYGIVDADMFVMSETSLQNINAKEYFFTLNEEKCETVFGKDLDFYQTEDNISFGIKVSSSLFEETSDNIYVLFSKKSFHLGDLNDTTLDGDIAIARLFI